MFSFSNNKRGNYRNMSAEWRQPSLSLAEKGEVTLAECIRFFYFTEDVSVETNAKDIRYNMMTHRSRTGRPPAAASS